jgi:hypothetical protein
MSDADALRLRAFYEHRAALNELVHAVERLEVPDAPHYPSWSTSPAGFEVGEKRTLEEAEALGLEWQDHASKLDDALQEVGFDDLENALSGVKALAAQAREALLRMNAYEPPMPKKY